MGENPYTNILAMNFNTYINNLEIRLLFSDDNLGKIYILNTDKTTILFIVDITDSCIYVNQDILDKFGYSIIKEFLDSIRINYSIFPYYPEEIEVIQSNDRFAYRIMHIIDSIKMDFSKFGDNIYFYYGERVMMKYDISENKLYLHFFAILSQVKRHVINDFLYRNFKSDIGVDILYTYRTLPVNKYFSKNV